MPEHEEWTPYVPPWYPDRGPNHNPWATDPSTIQSGSRTFYAVWMDSLAPGEIAQLIADDEAGARA